MSIAHREIRNAIVGMIIGLAILVLATSQLSSQELASQELATQELSFRNDVLPVLSKHGCNSGACHGALAGKGGFRLSLQGYDPESDHFNITRQARGRRVELAEPARSLILRKPTGDVPHKGGVLFAPDSEEYKLIDNWIRTGAAAPTDLDSRVERVEIQPESSTVMNGESAELKVIAHFDNGQKRDVTTWAKFSSTNETVTRVNETGKVEVIGFGEGAITAWYSSKIGIARISSPFDNKIDANVFTKADSNNFIDELVLAKLQRLNIPPSKEAAPQVFVRRAFLDAIGTLPTPEEVQQFLDDKSEDRKAKLIDDLLARPEFVDYWSYQWSDLLLINGTRLRPKAVEAFYKWVRSNVESNVPWDQFVRDILTAKGSSVENGATNFYALHQNPEEMAENASQAFMGLSIGCAKCHNHPLEKWTNDQYYAFASHFSRVRAKGWGGDPRNGDGVRTLFLAQNGELVQPIRGVPQPPTPLDGDPIGFDYQGDRRQPLADWMTSPDNPYFARSITNRIWARFMGKGLVENVDDMRLTNPASNEELLQASADFLVEKKFDVKQLMRAILLSATYQRSSEALPENKDETRFYSRYYPKRLMAEVLLDSISQVTEVPTPFNKIAFPGADIRDTKFYPEGTKAIQLYDAAVVSYFLKAFGRNQREITCECQRTGEPSMVQVLHISNGDTMNNKLETEDNWLGKMLKANENDSLLIESAYLRTLARKPTSAELKQIETAFGEYKPEARRKLFEDLMWGLMSSREFLFNH